MRGDGVISETYSVCPVCLRRLPALRVRRGGEVRLERECPEHGFFSAVVWQNFLDFDEWVSGAESADKWNPDCPSACGLCASHLRDTCCVLFEVTSRCDLSDCAFCFADNSADGSDPSLSELISEMRGFVRPGRTFIQLSGGEPSVRDDLHLIVRAAAGLGCKYIQLNTNGIRIARDEKFIESLASEGLSFVFMQFDGTDDGVYRKLRGRDLLEIKKRAVENCARAGVGVTLVPTLARGVNTGSIGDIVKFAVSRSPTVRGVHFQPVCLMGRYPGVAEDKAPFTLDELVHEIKLQSGGLLDGAAFLPSSCDHPLCGFHSDFVVLPGGDLYPLSIKQKSEKNCCRTKEDRASQNREFVGRRWKRTKVTRCCADERGGDISDMEYFAARAQSHAFTLTAMAFQDAWRLDLERLRSCSLHVFRGGRTVPFCANYLTPAAKG